MVASCHRLPDGCPASERLAGQAHGATRATQHEDISPEWSNQNLARLTASLTELQARLKIGDGSFDTLELQIGAHTIHSLESGAAWRPPGGDCRSARGGVAFRDPWP